MTRSHAEWERIVAEYEAGQLSQPEFCRRRGLALSTLQYWVRKLKRRRVDVQMVPVRVVPDGSAGGQLEARIGAIVLRFHAGTDAQYVAAVFREIAKC